jgi:hypothetical protein
MRCSSADPLTPRCHLAMLDGDPFTTPTSSNVGTRNDHPSRARVQPVASDQDSRCNGSTSSLRSNSASPTGLSAIMRPRRARRTEKAYFRIDVALARSPACPNPDEAWSCLHWPCSPVADHGHRHSERTTEVLEEGDGLTEPEAVDAGRTISRPYRSPPYGAPVRRQMGLTARGAVEYL